MKVNTPSFGEVELLDFTTLSYEIKIDILEMRNHPKVREQMHGQNIIDECQHLNFIKSLKYNDEKKYFLVKYKGKFAGVIYFTDINQVMHSAVFGLYANLHKKIDKTGSILMESALAFFNNSISLETLSLEVYESNKIAENLYLKFGFSTDGFFYQDSDKVLSMELVKNNL